jgi:hypothetical protein
MRANETSATAATVVVSGDVTMDWNLARRAPPGLGGGWHPDLRARASRQRGGAALLADLVEASLEDRAGAGPRVLATDASAERTSPDEGRYSHSYAVWAPCAAARGERRRVWRVDPPMGLDRATSDATVREEWERLGADLLAADAIALDDADLGFRDRSDPELWRRVAEGGRDPWVLLKTSRPIAEGPLWEHLREHRADRLVVLMTIADLRGTDVQVSRELSWERTAQDLYWELVHNPLVNGLSRCAHTVVSFGAAGALLLSGAPGKLGEARCSLLFDPAEIEGTWESERPGAMIGATACLAASLTRELALAPAEPDLERAIGSGVGAGRRLWDEGYGSAGQDMDVRFPFSAVAEEIVGARSPLAAIEVEDPAGSLGPPAGGDRGAEADDGRWTILEDRYADDLGEVAAEVALRGPEVALEGVPLGRFGKLLTVDRGEIESYRSVRSLISEYTRAPRSKPLSIAVFGPPGAGKSFGIVEVAGSVAPGLMSEPLEFNLSQFESLDGLADALHQVRDVGLTGKVPLVFWDEFDSPLGGTELGWLRYFLAPMQDGEFRQGQLAHPIGQAIFVFAGGTKPSVEEFRRKVEEEDASLKGTDFLSRLKGYVDILGPDPLPEGADPHSVIRRAILFRSLIARNAGQLLDREGRLQIDPGVLRAFLQIGSYRHGVRSMEAIVTTSRLAGETSFQRSSLPSEAQLDLHVGGREFLALVQQLVLEEEELLDRLSEATHEVFCEDLRERGETTDALVPWGELPDYLKEQNRAAVRDIPEKLAQIDHVMVPARSHDAPFDFPGEALEQLARAEHDRYVEMKLADGWRCGPQKDERLKTNPTLVPWEELSEDEREKDRAQVRGIPRILARAGYTVVRAARD